MPEKANASAIIAKATTGLERMSRWRVTHHFLMDEPAELERLAFNGLNKASSGL